MNIDAPAHLLITDRDERLRELLRQFLRNHGFLVSLARDEDHARRLLGGLEFDLIVLDGQLPDARALCEACSAPVLELVAKGAQRASAAEMIEKPFEPKALLERINAILDRRPAPAAAGPKMLKLGDLSFDVDRGVLKRGADHVRLTSTEIQLMRVFAAQVGTPVGRGELVAHLGRTGLATKARAIDVQITRLRRKVEDDPKAPRYLQTVRGAGYMLVAD